MYEKDKKTRITIRVNQEQFDCVNSKAEVLGVSPSEFIRMLINSLLYAEKKTGNPADLLKGGFSRENDETDKHNKL